MSTIAALATQLADELEREDTLHRAGDAIAILREIAGGAAPADAPERMAALRDRIGNGSLHYALSACADVIRAAIDPVGPDRERTNLRRAEDSVKIQCRRDPAYCPQGWGGWPPGWTAEEVRQKIAERKRFARAEERRAASRRLHRGAS